jgi:hypothetical protein
MAGFASRHAFHAATPFFSRAMCSSFAMRVVQHDCQRYATILHGPPDALSRARAPVRYSGASGRGKGALSVDFMLTRQ